jgi:hypothetical protein
MGYGKLKGFLGGNDLGILLQVTQLFFSDKTIGG